MYKDIANFPEAAIQVRALLAFPRGGLDIAYRKGGEFGGASTT
jgi:hypothetical protein